MKRPQTASHHRVEKLRKMKAQNERKARIAAIWNQLKSEGQREIFREGRRQVRGHVRRRLKRFLPLI